jgi:AraC-like DNA-binding protein
MTTAAPAAGPLGSLDAVLPLLEHLESVGCDPGAVLDRAGIPSHALESPRMRLPQRRFEALWHAAIEATGDPAIALRVAAQARPGTLGVIGYLASASESRRSAFEVVKGLTPLLWEDFACELEGDERVAFLRCRPARRASRFTTEYAVGLTVSMSRTLGPLRCEPLEARFSHRAPPYAAECERILDLPVRFAAGEDGVLFPAALLDLSNPSADAALRELLERHAADQLARLVANAPFAQRVRACLLALLPAGGLTADRVAERFAMSPRTFRRRLREAGTSYQEVLDAVRAELARRHLERERRGIDEVAFLLGFSDPSAFSKAFRRWTGCTPTAFLRDPRSAAPIRTGRGGRNRPGTGPLGTGARAGGG